MKNEIPVCEEACVHDDALQIAQQEMLSTDQYNNLGTLFKMFADPTRLKIISALFNEELCVCDISALLYMTQSAVSHQLSVLRNNRLIKYRRDGKNIYYALDDEHIQMIYNAGLAHILEK